MQCHLLKRSEEVSTSVKQYSGLRVLFVNQSERVVESGLQGAVPAVAENVEFEVEKVDMCEVEWVEERGCMIVEGVELAEKGTVDRYWRRKSVEREGVAFQPVSLDPQRVEEQAQKKFRSSQKSFG